MSFKLESNLKVSLSLSNNQQEHIPVNFLFFWHKKLFSHLLGLLWNHYSWKTDSCISWARFSEELERPQTHKWGNLGKPNLCQGAGGNSFNATVQSPEPRELEPAWGLLLVTVQCSFLISPLEDWYTCNSLKGATHRFLHLTRKQPLGKEGWSYS